MGRDEIKSLLLQGGDDFAVVNNEIYSFFWDARILSNRSYEIEALLNDPELLAEVQKSEFNLVDNSHYDKESGSIISSIEVVNEAYLKERHRLRDRSKCFFRYVTSSEITSLYLLKVDIIVKGVRIPPSHYVQFIDSEPDNIYVLRFPEYKHLSVGEVRNPLEPRDWIYLVPLKDIDQIVGVKCYRDPSNIGKYDYTKFTGEKEEVVLDLHHFDEDAYRFFTEHNALEVKFAEK